MKVQVTLRKAMAEFASHQQLVNCQVKTVLNCVETIESIHVYIILNIQNRRSRG